MSKIYCVVIGSTHSKDEVTTYFDTVSDIEFWFSALPSCIFIKTEKTAKYVGQLFENRFGTNNYFITKIDTDYWGRMEGSLWKQFKPADNK